jgi:hypothetical protein
MNKKKWMILIFLFLLFIPNIFTSSSTHKSHGGDFRGFLIAGERFLQGSDLYEGSSVATNVTWPPFFAMVMVPFVLLARVNLPMTQVLWYLIITTVFLISIVMWSRIVRLKSSGRTDREEDPVFYSPVLWIPLVCVSGPLLDNAAQLQSAPLLLFFVTMGLAGLLQEKPLQAGAWFGIAASIKAFPVLLAVPLLYRKNYRALAAMILAGVLSTAVPVLRYGIEGYLKIIQEWIALSFSGGYPLGGLSQSVYAMVGRYTALNPFELMVKRFPSPPPDDPGIVAATWIYRILLVICIAVVYYLIHKRNYRNSALEFSYFTVLMTIFSPISWRHYFVLMLPAWIFLTFCWVNKKDIVLKGAVIGSGILITGLYLLGQTGKPVRGFLLCVMSNFTLGAFVILGGLLYCIVRNYGNENQPALSTKE